MKEISLNFDWKYSPDFKSDYLANKFDDSKFETVNIPHTNKEIPYNYFDENDSCFVSCYRKHLKLPKEYKEKNLIIRFEACGHYAKVYLNGEKISEHKGGYTAFDVDITKQYRFEEDNVLVVELDSSEREEIPPFGGVIDYLTYGGIYREVTLFVHEDTYIKNIKITPLEVLTENISVDIEIELNKKAKIEVPARIVKDSGEALTGFIIKSDCESEKIKVNKKINKKVDLWDIDSPILYNLEIEMGGYTLKERFGFRDAVFKNKGFYLNGRLLKIRGLNRHQSFPYVGYAMPKTAQYADAEYLKYSLGVNLVRTSHYPNSKHFLRRCDEIGLLVFTEIPGWQHIGDSAEWHDLCLQHVEEMIKEGYNHPSIILWGVRINESGDNKELYTRTNKRAHELDSSRQTGGVRFLPRSQFLEDVYTFNDFIHSGGRAVLMPKFFVAGKKPYLVTEHNGHMFPTKSFDHEKKRQEHALRHARVLNKMYKTKGISGAIGWCMSDYNTHKDFGSGDKICYHGVSDMFRIEKLAASVYKSQQEQYGVLEITSNMEIGDVAGGRTGDVYIITNCDEIKLYKNGVEILVIDVKKEAKKFKEFKHLPHPLIKLVDVIGNQLDNAGIFKGKDANRMKKVLLKAKVAGAPAAVIRYPLTALYLITRYKLGINGVEKLFGQYVTSWGAKQSSFLFEGYKDGKKVAVVEKAAASEKCIVANIDKNLLTEDATYDVAKVTIKAKSQVGNVLPYDNSSIEVITEGPIKLIGPSQFSLIGGARAFWVKSFGEKGKAKITVVCAETGYKEVFDIQVQ